MSSPGVASGRLSDDQRRAIFAEQLQQAMARGLRLESQIQFEAVLVEGRPIGHTLHVALTFFTVGIWGFVWAVIVKRGGEKVHQLVVDALASPLVVATLGKRMARLSGVRVGASAGCPTDIGCI